MRALRAFWKLLRAVLHAGRGWWTIRVTFRGLTPAQREARVQQWAQRLLAILGVELVVQGVAPAPGPVLLVANHLSWLDIVVIHATQHARFVSRAVVHRWPLIGPLATGAGTLYIERERRRDTLRVMHDIAQALREGGRVAVFPEGAIGDGLTMQPFHANLLQAPISVDAPVQPLALRYADAASGQTSLAPRYFGDESLLGSLWRTLCAPPLVAFVRLGEVQTHQQRDRRAWVAALQDEVCRLYLLACR